MGKGNNSGELRHDFGGATTVRPEVAKLAAKAVVLNSTGTEDALALLDMLGLIQPRPGNEPLDLRSQQGKDRRATDRARRAQLELEKLGVTPQEIGEL
jgi:hypothetical protein